ncbi:Efflux ABC transporter, ATP-binding protein, partial [hydrothermal vent metagenome]
KGIQMRVHHGEVFGLLGPNGAGKSTLVKILMTVIRPSRCTGTMLGQPVGSQSVLRRIGYLPEHHRFPPYLTGAQVLDFYAALTEVPKATRKARIPELLELVGMQDWGGVKVSRYSKGMRQRVGIAQALMNDPDIVLLDEPTDGVDPVGRRDIREILAELKRRGKTVFLNSHLLSELEMVCDRVAILVHGEVATQGTIDELTAGKERYEIELAPEDADSQLDTALAGVVRFAEAEEHEQAGERDARPTGKLATGEWVEVDRAMLRVGTTEAATIQPIIDRLRAHGAVIKSIRQCRPSLEDLFMAAVSEQGEGVGGTKPGNRTPQRTKGGRA